MRHTNPDKRKTHILETSRLRNNALPFWEGVTHLTKMPEQSYTIERWGNLGWTISAPAKSRGGIPLTALPECMPLFGKTTAEQKKKAMYPGIASHLNESGYPNVIFCMATEKNAAIWEEEIRKSLEHHRPETRWWRGTDTGNSSKAIFAVLCDASLCILIRTKTDPGKSKGETPHDSGDMNRCLRLIESIPEWEGRLQEVADAYPGTHWPAIIRRWQEIKKSDNPGKNRILQEIENGD